MFQEVVRQKGDKMTKCPIATKYICPMDTHAA